MGTERAVGPVDSPQGREDEAGSRAQQARGSSLHEFWSLFQRGSDWITNAYQGRALLNSPL